MIVCPSHADVASQLENLIAEKVGPQRYKVWFKNATRFLFADGFLKVGVPNLFIGGWIESHFIETIADAAQEVTGRRPEVVFSIDAELARELRKKQPDSQVDFVANNPEREARQRMRSGSTPPARPLKGRLEDFVVGTSNRMAFAAAQSVAEQPATQYNPLFIHGGCGLGKTHLLQGICNEIQRRRPELACRYVSGEDFTNQFVFAVKGGNRDAFQHRFRNVDVLIIDDIHFFANKRATQEEFLHTYNAIDAAGRQVVMSSDAHPKLIGHLSDSLVTRFVSGMVVKIESPDLDVRAEILRRRARKMNLHCPEPVIDFVAHAVQTNVRELEGALLRLVAATELDGEPLTVELAERSIRDLLRQTVPIVRLSDIESGAAIFFGLTPADLHTSRKTRTIALARGIAMYLARKHTDMSFPEIGRFMGNKDHSTVILATRRIQRLLDGDETVRWMTPSGECSRKITQLMDELETQIEKGNGTP
ncbi:MAG TPA: chromosomal replication initiator protein DnaA [Phycisphaerae bacterium]|nr:chromosomal replication initiator protein DnaA [Phycisphaerae bacterium]